MYLPFTRTGGQISPLSLVRVMFVLSDHTHHHISHLTTSISPHQVTTSRVTSVGAARPAVTASHSLRGADGADQTALACIARCRPPRARAGRRQRKRPVHRPWTPVYTSRRRPIGGHQTADTARRRTVSNPTTDESRSWVRLFTLRRWRLQL